MRELLPMVVSIVLFFVTLIIIITIRKADRKDRSIELAKRYSAQHAEKLRRSGEEMKTMIAEVESRFYKAQNDAEVVIAQITEQKKELFSHLEDLQRLQGTIVQYHKVLTNLSEMTNEVELRTQKVENEMVKVKEAQQMISDFNSAIVETQEEIDASHQQLHQSMSVYKTKIDQQIEEALVCVNESFQKEKHRNLEEIDTVFQQLRETSASLLKEIGRELNSLEQSNELLVSSHNYTLEDIKTRCDEQLEKIDQYVQESNSLKENLTSLHKEIALLEKEREVHEQNVKTLNEELQLSHEEKEELNEKKRILEEEIEEALNIQKQLKEEEELSSLIERERIDYPDIDDLADDEEDPPLAETEDQQIEAIESISVEEDSLLNKIELDEDTEITQELKDKKKPIVDHSESIDEIEEGEEEIRLEDDENEL